MFVNTHTTLNTVLLADDNCVFDIFYLFVYSRHEVHSMNTHTLQNAG